MRNEPSPIDEKAFKRATKMFDRAKIDSVVHAMESALKNTRLKKQ
jgi:hypothetical protein